MGETLEEISQCQITITEIVVITWDRDHRNRSLPCRRNQVIELLPASRIVSLVHHIAKMHDEGGTFSCNFLHDSNAFLIVLFTKEYPFPEARPLRITNKDDRMVRNRYAWPAIRSTLA